MAHIGTEISHSDPDRGFWASRPGYKPVLLLIAILVFIGLVMIPPHQSMIDLVSREKPPGYKLGPGCKTITETVNKKLRPAAYLAKGEAAHGTGEETVEQVYAGPALEEGMYYQFRVTSYRDKQHGGRTLISTTEDLKGVFYHEPDS